MVLHRSISLVSHSKLGAALAAAALLAALPSFAQSANDALEQPYGTEPAPSGSTSAGTPAPSATTTSQSSIVVDEPPPVVEKPLTGPLRSQRRLMLALEAGWNGLAGVGPTLSYQLHPHFVVDLGTGLSLTGLKGGLRLRYEPLTTPLTPFLGAGMLGSTGLGVISGNFASNNQQVTLRVRPTAALQAVAGIDWMNRKGISVVATLGYAFVLNHNVDEIAGTVTPEDRRGYEIAFGSGPVVAASLGYAFR